MIDRGGAPERNKIAMPLYTFVMDFLGGIYIEQVRARSVRQACVKWAEKLDPKSVKGLGPVGRGELLEKMRQELPTPLDGTVNSWCATALPRGRFALINIIRTDEGAE